MIVNQSRIAEISAGVLKTFTKGLKHYEDKFPGIAVEVNSKNAAEVYNWLGDVPAMREANGDTEYDQLEAFTWTIRNRTYKAGLVVKIEDLEDDNLGLIMPKVGEMAKSAVFHKMKLMSELMSDGFSENGYDGVPFYSASHARGASTISNLETGPLSGAKLDSAILKFDSMVDRTGEALDIEPDLLIIGPSNRATARDLFDVPFDNAGATNPYYKTMKYIVNRRLKTAAEWHLLSTNAPMKPFIYQDRVPAYIRRLAPNGGQELDSDVIKWVARARRGAGYGEPLLAVGSTGL